MKLKQKGGDLIDHLNFTSIMYVIAIGVFISSIITIFINARLSAILLGIGLLIVLVGFFLSPFSKMRYN